jgi:hypothetical protein
MIVGREGGKRKACLWEGNLGMVMIVEWKGGKV